MTIADHTAALRKLARQGTTRRQAAEAMGISYWAVCAIASRAGIAFTHGNERAGRRKTTPIGLLVKAGAAEKLTAQERLDVRVLVRKGGYSAHDALRVVGRADLIPVIEAAGAR